VIPNFLVGLLFSFSSHLIIAQIYAGAMLFVYLSQDSQIKAYQFLSYILILIAQKIQVAFQTLNFVYFQTTLAFIFLLRVTFPLYQ
jgi:hypothetical protein